MRRVLSNAEYLQQVHSDAARFYWSVKFLSTLMFTQRHDLMKTS